MIKPTIQDGLQDIVDYPFVVMGHRPHINSFDLLPFTGVEVRVFSEMVGERLVYTDNLNAGVAVMKSAQDGA